MKHDFRVISKPTHRLLADLKASRANGSYNCYITSIPLCGLLILDDFGLQTSTPASIQYLYEIICERYETGSILVTSNRAFEEWAEIFNDDLLSYLPWIA
ncbi:MAG: IstB domain-containing protein ATP-binding protein [Chloroflexi bacterium]|nr:MAG: IstB domain-containing protein ATP-binding protein [Chloroflexota bacterium]